MSTDQAVPGGNEQSSGAEIGETPQKQIETPKPESVAREAYERAVSEAKSAKAELKKLKDADLLKNNEYQKLYESEKLAREEVEKKHSGLNQRITESKKLSALMAKLPGKVDQSYWDLIDLEKIAADPETGAIDDASVARYAKEFETKHARLIDRPNTARVPQGAPSSVKDIGYDEWLTLPLKEQKARMKDIIK